MPMDIYSKPNTKVFFLDENGYDYDRETAQKYMKKGDFFTVKHIEVGNWSSTVFFNEIPDQGFNTVMFEELKEEEVSFRKLATIRKVADVEPIPGADSIECLTVDGWKLVSGKDNFKVGDLCIYFEIDSFLPVREEFEFLRKNGFKSTKNLGDGFRLKTIRLRGQISQGLSLPLADFFSQDKKGWYYISEGENLYIDEGSDVTEYLGVKKYEKPIPANMMGRAKGNFPIFIHKTDQERLQNCFGGVWKWVNKEKSSEYMDKLPFMAVMDGGECLEIQEAKGGIHLSDGTAFFPKEEGWVRTSYKDNTPEVIAEREVFEATIKLDGSSMTVYHFNGDTGVCSRNFDLAETDDNTFWNCAREYDMVDYVKSTGCNIALQGEVYGEGVQENHDKLKGLHFFLFDIFDIDQNRYMTPTERKEFLQTYVPKFEHVPVINSTFRFNDFECVAQFVDFVNEQKSINNPIAEGVVFKSYLPQGPTFKVISSKFLLKEKD